MFKTGQEEVVLMNHAPGLSCPSVDWLVGWLVCHHFLHGLVSIRALVLTKVTTGMIGIDLERKLVINNEADPNIWRTNIDQK